MFEALLTLQGFLHEANGIVSSNGVPILSSVSKIKLNDLIFIDNY